MCLDLQDRLLESERQKASAEAQVEVLQRFEGLKHVEAGATPPSQSAGSGVVAAAPTCTDESMQILSSQLLEYVHLSTRLMADAKSSC